MSPQNVFVTYNGPSKLLDFGIAKTAGTPQTREAVIKGKMGYMAPEQAQGKPIDRRADVFAMGVMLWEAIAGRRLVEREDDEVSALARRLCGNDPHILDVKPDAPAELVAICTKALGVDPESRFTTALEMQSALAGWLRSQPDPADARKVAAVLDVFEAERARIRRLVEEQVRRLSSPGVIELGRPSSAETAPPVLEEAAFVGKIVGQRYRLERPIGSGGMGFVFEATQLDLRRKVAVKVLQDLRPHRIERLRQEALSGGSITSPHVVAIFDFQAPPDEHPFLVMELLEGESLADVLNRVRRIESPRAARIAFQVLLALEAAHRAGVIHRDVKPANVWLQSAAGVSEHVKVLDFGIAKLLNEEGLVQTATGIVPGTPSYIAPEQLRGLRADGRADIHAVGVLLFEMLTGRVPWETDPSQRSMEIVARKPRLVHEVVADVPPSLSLVVARALAKDPDARYPTAAEMRADLAPFADLSSPGPGQPETVARPQRASSETAPTRTVDGVGHPSAAYKTTVADSGQASVGEAPRTGRGDTASMHVTFEATSGKPPRFRTGVAVLLATVMVGGVGLVAAKVKRQRGEAPAVSSVPSAVPALAEAPPSAPPVEPAHDAATPISSVRVKIVANPTTAQILIDGRAAGNPHEVTLAPDADEHLIEVSAKGYTPQTRRLAFDRDVNVLVTLERAPKAPRPPGTRSHRAIDDVDPY